MKSELTGGNAPDPQITQIDAGTTQEQRVVMARQLLRRQVLRLIGSVVAVR